MDYEHSEKDFSVCIRIEHFIIAVVKEYVKLVLEDVFELFWTENIEHLEEGFDAIDWFFIIFAIFEFVEFLLHWFNFVG